MSPAPTFGTQISIGCANCSFAKQHNIGRDAVVSLIAIDTSRDPIRMEEYTTLKLEVNATDAFGGATIETLPVQLENGFNS